MIWFAILLACGVCMLTRSVVLTFSSLQGQYCEGPCKSDSLLTCFFPLFCVVILTRYSVCFVLWFVQPSYLVPISAMVKVSFSDSVLTVLILLAEGLCNCTWTAQHSIPCFAELKQKAGRTLLLNPSSFGPGTLHGSP